MIISINAWPQAKRQNFHVTKWPYIASHFVEIFSDTQQKNDCCSNDNDGQKYLINEFILCDSLIF